jgi:DNA repair protein RadC
MSNPSDDSSCVADAVPPAQRSPTASADRPAQAGGLVAADAASHGHRREHAVSVERLDRAQLEAIVLDPPRCGDATPAFGKTERERRLQHVLAAAHVLLVRIAHETIVGRRFVDSPELVKQYLAVLFAGAQRELFVTVFLDCHLRVIGAETLFTGTLSQTSVYPREFVRRALYHNAASVVLAHNHPSGLAEPSRADEYLTQQLKAALMLIDVRVIDHIVVAGECAASFAERGLV